ncbi:MAG: hypothetical protein ACYCPT_09450 [Acidimicrobiales bacterium]
MRRLKQIWFIAGVVASLYLVVSILAARLGSGGWLWYLFVVPLIGAAVGSWSAAFGRRARDSFHIHQIWFFLGAIAALLLAGEVRPFRSLIGVRGSYVFTLALLGAATGSVVAATKR